MSNTHEPAYIKETFTKSGISNAHVAKSLGITRTYLSLVLNGKVKASEELMNKLRARAQKLIDSGLAA